MHEFELLRRIYRHNARLPSFVLVPPGDDCAVLRIGAESLLCAVDQVIAGRHVRADERPDLIGRKVVVRNVSDVAAMAARPFATMATVALPAGYPDRSAEELFEGVRATAELFGCPLVGGDLASHADGSAPLVCTVSILALPAWPGARVVTRRGARLGDGVYVTGALGGSLGADGRGRHLTFEPRVREGIELLRSLGDELHSMIDISDGLGRDAAHLVEGDEGGGLHIELDGETLPLSHGCSWRDAVRDGEDYELLFTASGALPARVGSTPLTRIGLVRERMPDEGGVSVRVGGSRHDVTTLGWEHAT